MKTRQSSQSVSRCLGMLVVLLSLLAPKAKADKEIRFRQSVLAPEDTTVHYTIDIDGQIQTPRPDGIQALPLKSNGRFEFEQRQYPKKDSGSGSLSAVRFFRTAETVTTVGANHTTSVNLPLGQRKIFIVGARGGLQAWCEQSRLNGKHLDLLEMPFDPLVVSHLLPSSPVTVGDKWNTPAWVVPMLLGVDAVVEEKTTCELQAVEHGAAVVKVAGTIEGAVRGSATKISFGGRLTVDEESSAIRQFAIRQKELRSPGPVSPGLDVTVDIALTQSKAKTPAKQSTTAPETPGPDDLLVALQTPLKLRLLHSREWHLFHETPCFLMMRQLRNGSLISQCNISSVVTVPPGEHTPDAEFLRDVEESVRERRGAVVSQRTIRDDDRWRVRLVRAKGDAGGESIFWDYHLCSSAGGEQYSIVFSVAASELDAFGDEAMQLLKTLSVVKRRLALPYR